MPPVREGLPPPGSQTMMMTVCVCVRTDVDHFETRLAIILCVALAISQTIARNASSLPGPRPWRSLSGLPGVAPRRDGVHRHPVLDGS